MPELRRDPVTGRWVIIATERAKRPSALVDTTPTEKIDKVNPFKAGNEHMTPPEILAYRPPGSKANSEGWWVRVFPNMYPALESEGEVSRAGLGMFDMMNGIGAHEVVVESPDEGVQLGDMDVEQVQEAIWAYRDRAVALRKDPRFQYVMIFKNYGKQAGASIWHPHSQIIALPIVPKNVQEKIEGARRYFDYKERCVFCDMIHQERNDAARVVMENDEFIAFCPYASRFPFEVFILPKQHACFFSDITKNIVSHLAEILQGTLRRLKLAVNDPAYNMIIHTTPKTLGDVPYFHWHIEILPALSRVAGFEWGSGFFINPIPPEDAAKFLRHAEMPGNVDLIPGEEGGEDLDSLKRISRASRAKVKKL
ncbi:MAG: UDPglucose--hexose-phosphate uridylyltransferase [Candidatus Sumerlaeota bacterium]|nr:UDPglucose--hexose-phosphate uridylyltransferase [Candidatus Sumerlaeota bacterium]